MTDPKPFDAYPNKAAWLADLDHSTCTKARDEICYSIHCVFCGASIGGGWAPCSCQKETTR